MSYWYTPRLKDIDYNKESNTLDIYLGNDYNGSIYCELDIDDIKQILKNNEKDTFKKRN